MKGTSFSFGTNPTKETIIELLSAEWPLTAKKLYRRLIKGYHLSITYQGVHKSLTELREKNIIEKTKGGYHINKLWLKGLGEFSQKLEQALEDKNQKREVKTMRKFTFNIHHDFIKFTLDLMENIVKKEGKLKMVFHFRHVPYFHMISNEDLQKMQSLMRSIQWTIISKNKTPLDKWNAKQWGKLGVKVMIDADIAADRRIIMNEYVLDAYMSKEALKKWDKIYAVKNLHNVDGQALNKSIFNQKMKTLVMVVEDRELAQMLLNRKKP